MNSDPEVPFASLSIYEPFTVEDHSMPTQSRSNLFVCLATAGLLGLSAAVHADTSPVAGAAVSSALTGKVTVVNLDKRLLTIETPEGRFEVLHVPPEVTRLDQVKIGNRVTIDKTEIVLLSLQKKGSGTPVGVTQDSSFTAVPGSKPAGTMVDSLTVTGVITAVDRARSSVTVQGPNDSVTFKVEDPTLLDGVAKGDTVSISYLREIKGEVKFR